MSAFLKPLSLAIPAKSSTARSIDFSPAHTVQCVNESVDSFSQVREG